MRRVRSTSRCLGIIGCLVACCAFAGDVSGRIILQKRLDRKIVGSAFYDLRGTSVPAITKPQKHGAFDHTAVWIETGRAENSVPPLAAKMQQIGRSFQPDFLIVPIGSTVEFPNRDPIFHNIFSLSRSRSFDLGYYAEGKSRVVTFTQAGVVQVYCHIHSDMFGVIVVAPGAWFAVPDQDGLFSFAGVPPGTHRLAVWHKTTGLVRKKLVVPNSGTARIDVALPEEGDE